MRIERIIFGLLTYYVKKTLYNSPDRHVKKLETRNKRRIEATVLTDMLRNEKQEKRGESLVY